jgi:hypothetical protein
VTDHIDVQFSYVEEPFTAGQIEELLRKARAPTPWRHPEMCEGAALALTMIAEQRLYYETLEPAVEMALEARAAAAKLQRLIPAMIEFARNNCDRIGTDPLVELTIWDRPAISPLEQLESIRKLLAEAFPADQPPRLGYAWHAGWLFGLYRDIVGSGTAHAKSPAMKFVAFALDAAGWRGTGRRKLTANAVAKAIKGANSPQ